ncbi:hypothetical protein Tc00.1047053510385.20 [Trypanosoma cruzi]|uniref:Uncharacterized protein n=1 Tax=Trypanosoma cruzi (strain CL Brener) TaxID=353153 RepID=Q4D377_TRYCC|nr:hypothetical protein Tc00.1047053510385.20 [Trypanosoma cruzi]EAN86980.1 hypothetical protein Tc00.1047053510385.20 [Trypanosoma cruzi]|eukprot:XP_808831.1 hypothetical protein [Trypanosoma cruzi strain CL Brener]
MPQGMEAPRPCPLGSAVPRYSWDRVCALSWLQENLLVRHTVRVARAAIPSAVCTVCACVSPGGCDVDGSFTPYALEFTIRHCLPCLAPGPGGALNVFLCHLAPAARSSHRTMINTSLADGSLRSSCETGTPLPSANTGRTHAARRELLANPAALCPARGERRTGPPPPVSTAGTPPMPVCIHATTRGGCMGLCGWWEGDGVTEFIASARLCVGGCTVVGIVYDRMPLLVTVFGYCCSFCLLLLFIYFF